MDSSTIVQLVLIIVAAVVLFGLFAYYNQFKKRVESEKFNTLSTAAASGRTASTAAKSRRRRSAVSAYNDDLPEEEEDVGSAARLGSKYGRGAADMEEEFDDRMDDYGSRAGSQQSGSKKSKPSFSYTESQMKDRVFGDEGGEEKQAGGVPAPIASESLDTELLKPVDFDDTEYSASGGDGGGAMNSGSIVDAQDLMPADAANTKYAKLNPAGQGSVSGQNFLNAGHHIGVNTVGQSLRNASHDIRQTPPNPRDVVSPWMQSTIAPDLMRRPLE